MKIFYRVLSSAIAGGQRVALDIIEEALARGHEAILSAPSQGKLTKIAGEKKIRIHYSPLRKTFHFHEAARLAGFLRRNRVDLVHSHDAVAGNVLVRTAGLLARVPVVSHIHIENAFNPRAGIQAYQKLLDNLTSRFCKRIVAVSRHTRDSLLRQGVPGHLLEVVANGVEVPALPARKSKKEILDELHLPRKARLIGCVGRLCPVKGQKELIAAAADILPHHPDAYVVFVGEDLEKGGEYKKDLERFAAGLSIGHRIRFAGYQSDVNSFMHAFEFLVLPSWIEGLPLVILEAMACGKAVAASKTGGTPELVIHERTGLLFEPRDIWGLKSAISRFLEDEFLAGSLGGESLHHVRRNFSRAGMMNRIFEIYGEATAMQGDLRKLQPIS